MTDFSHEAAMIVAVIREEAAIIRAAVTSPSVLYKPTIAPDGNMWCALLGENLMEGVCGFGETPEKAMADFDRAWRKDPTHWAKMHAAEKDGADG